VSMRSELRKAFAEYTFRMYRCTGKNCEFKVEAIEGLEIFCNTAGCRGICKPGRVVPKQKVINDELARISKASLRNKLTLQGDFHGVSRSESDQKPTNDSLLQVAKPIASKPQKFSGAFDSSDSPIGNSGGA